MRRPQKYDLREARRRILSYCAKQERCHKEVEDKLHSWGLSSSTINDLISYLIEHNFLDEGRYASLYVRSKFNQNSWGWIKIRQGLKQKNILDNCIQIAYQELDLSEYKLKAKKLMIQKRESLAGNKFEVRSKLFRYLMQKGFERDIINRVYKELYD